MPHPQEPTRRRSLGWLCAGMLLHFAPLPTLASEPPALLLAQVYRAGMALDDHWISEKYDGLRGFWDGQRLRTRGGETIHAPCWFTAGWPAQAMDGELWAGRGRFEQALSTVRQLTPKDDAWRSIRFMVFDLPTHPGRFTERVLAYQELVAQLNQPWVQAVPQRRATTHDDLMAQLDAMVRDGGEGLMLRRASSFYRAVRSDDLLKVKTHEDAEALVLAHLPGKGRHTGRLGALLMQTPQGLSFSLGTGFSDAQRRDPPPVGSWVTYRFRGQHASGLPRFASFVRVRDTHDMPPAATTDQTHPR
jgi:DNA ligase 1